MSDIDEGGERSPEAKAFLARHQATGEPSKEALDRVLNKLSAPATAPAADAKVLPLRRKRPFLPHEVMAAAAVVTILLGAQGAYLLWRTPPAPPPPASGASEVQAISAAWTQGDFAQVQRLASRQCASDECRPLVSELNQMLNRAQHVGTLTPEQREQLLAFDLKMSGGKGTALTRQLSGVTVSPLSAHAEQVALGERLFREAEADRKTKDFPRAAERLEECVKTAPAYYPCFRLLGSVYAAIAARDMGVDEQSADTVEQADLSHLSDATVERSAANMERARQMYELFLEVAPADDEYVPKVTAILEAARNDEEPAPSGQVLPQVRLQRGESKILKIPGLQRVAVGDPSTVDVKTIGGDRLEVIGVDAGRTTLLAWTTSGERYTANLEVAGTRAGPSNLQQVDDAVPTVENEVSVTVMVGGQGMVSFGPLVVRVAVGDPDIADISTAGTQIKLKGVHVGKTTLLAWLASGERKSVLVKVVAAHASTMAKVFQQATKARDSGNWARAVELARQVVKSEPTHGDALALLEEGRQEARDAYMRGYQMRDVNPEEARRLFLYVMSLTQPEDDLNQKVKSRLAELAP